MSEVSLETFRELVDAANVGLNLYDEQLNLVATNEYCVRLFGWDRDAVMGTNLADLAPRPHNAKLWESIEMTLADGIPRSVLNENLEYNFILDDYIFRVGRFLAVQVVDVTARVINEHRLGELLAMLPVELFSYDVSSGQFFLIDSDSGSPQVTDILQRLDVDSVFSLQSAVQQALVTDRVTMTLRAADGIGRFQASLTVMGKRRSRVLLVLIDISNQTLDEQSLSRLEHAGRVQLFAQGLAHDFSNIAQAIEGYTHLLESNPSLEVVRAVTQGLQSAVRRTNAVTGRIRRIAEIQTVSLSVLDVAALVRDYRETMQAILGPRVQLHVEAPTAAFVRANADHLRSALDNLCQNAAEAMGYEGELSVTLRAQVHSATRQVVDVTVSDTGPGIDPSLVDRIFLPFVSRGRNEGRGLGLYLVHEYLDACGGTVSVTSSDHGAAFTLRLPAVA